MVWYRTTKMSMSVRLNSSWKFSSVFETMPKATCINTVTNTTCRRKQYPPIPPVQSNYFQTKKSNKNTKVWQKTKFRKAIILQLKNKLKKKKKYKNTYFDVSIGLIQNHLIKFRILQRVKEVWIQAVKVWLNTDSLHNQVLWNPRHKFFLHSFL